MKDNVDDDDDYEKPSKSSKTLKEKKLISNHDITKTDIILNSLCHHDYHHRFSST
jgi:hypothetical protein